MEFESTMIDQRVFRFGCRPPEVPGPVTEQMWLAHRYRITLTLIERARRAAIRSGVDRETVKLREGELVRGARELSALRWGTYQLVEAAMQMSSKTTPMHSDPRWPAWTGDGAISEQLIKGMGVHELETHTQVQLVPAPLAHGPRAQEFRILRLRVGSEGRTPVWAEFPLHMHRDLPSGTRIKRVTVHRRLGGARTANLKSGRRERWEAQFIVEMPLAASRCGDGVVGLDIGWRRIKKSDELRVCAWAGESDSAFGDLRLSSHAIGGFHRVDSLRATRDEMRGRALEFVRGLRDVAPDWYRVATAHAHVWRAPKKIALLVVDWRRNHPEFDPEALRWLEHWLGRDRHLWQWESDQREKNHNARDKFYEGFGKMLAEKYETLVVEKFDLRKFARRPADDAVVDGEGRKESRQEEKARAWRHMASTSRLRSIVMNAFFTRGGGVVEMPAHDTTRKCSSCGLIVRRDFGTTIEWTCDCGMVHDQDVNAGNNLCEDFRACEKAGTARIKKAGKTKEEIGGGRFRRGKKKKDEAKLSQNSV